MAHIDYQATLFQMQQERSEKQRAALHSLSPIRRLPNKNLLCIFEYLCEDNMLLLDPRNLQLPLISYLPAMSISFVCYRWRELAISSPSLWASLRMTQAYEEVNPYIERYRAGFTPTLDLFIERSSDFPLRITLDMPCNDGDLFALGKPLAPLVRHAHRWKIYKYHHLFYNELSKSQFHSLTELDLISGSRSPYSNDLDMFEHSSKLRSLILSTMPQNPSRFPYHQLVHADFGIDSVGTLDEHLHRCPSLKSLVLRSYGREPEDPEAKPESEGVWRNITSLVIVNESLGKVSNILFPSFSFPSLNELQIVEDSEPPYLNTGPLIPWPKDTFSSFLSISSCTITTFTILGISISDLELIAALQLMPSLSYLEINDKPWHKTQLNPITPHLISSLTLPQFNKPSLVASLVPKLHTLHMFFHGTTFNDYVFISMIQSHWFKPGSDLQVAMLSMGMSYIRSVILKFKQRDVDVEVYKPLGVLDEQGLRVTVDGKNGVQI